MSVEAEYRCAAGAGLSAAGPERHVADDETDLILHHLPRRVAAEHPRRHIIGVVRHIAIGVRVGVGRRHIGMDTQMHVPVMAVARAQPFAWADAVTPSARPALSATIKVFARKRMGLLEASLTRTLTVRPGLKPALEKRLPRVQDFHHYSLTARHGRAGTLAGVNDCRQEIRSKGQGGNHGRSRDGDRQKRLDPRDRRGRHQGPFRAR